MNPETKRTVARIYIYSSLVIGIVALPLMYDLKFGLITIAIGAWLVGCIWSIRHSS